MALFSQRFWMQLSALDGKVVLAQRAQQAASARLLVCRRVVTGDSLVVFWSELLQTTEASAAAVTDLNHFCAGRNRSTAASLGAGSLRNDAGNAVLEGPDTSPAIG